MTRFWDGQTDGRTDGVTALLDLLSPSATQVKIYKEEYRMCAGDSQMLRNKHNFVISIIAINMFYSTCKGFNFIVTDLALQLNLPVTLEFPVC